MMDQQSELRMIVFVLFFFFFENLLSFILPATDCGLINTEILLNHQLC